MLILKVSANRKAILTVLAIVAVSSAIVLVAVPALWHPSYIITAERLSQQPDAYIVLENPDAVVSQAISNPQESTEIPSLDATQIDELIDEHNDNPFNVKVNESYFQIGIVSVDRFPPPFMSLLSWVSLVTLPLSVVTITIILVRTMKQNADK